MTAPIHESSPTGFADSAATLAFEDFHEGDTASFGAYHVTAEEIVEFAAAFDPQVFHLDPEAAKDTPLRGLAASGWHTASIGMRMICDGFVGRSSCLGSPGVEEVRWLAPVRPDDHLCMRARVTAVRASRSRPDRGMVTFAFAILNQDDVCVMTQDNTIMFGRRQADPAA